MFRHCIALRNLRPFCRPIFSMVARSMALPLSRVRGVSIRHEPSLTISSRQVSGVRRALTRASPLSVCGRGLPRLTSRNSGGLVRKRRVSPMGWSPRKSVCIVTHLAMPGNRFRIGASPTPRERIMQTAQFAIVAVILTALSFKAEAQQFKPNYDEAKVPKYTLPDPLVMLDGTKVSDVDTWKNKRRPEILKLYEDHVFGETPGGKPKDMTFEVTSIEKKALGGKAVRKEVTIYFTGKKDGPKMDLLIYLPADAKG